MVRLEKNDPLMLARQITHQIRGVDPRGRAWHPAEGSHH